MNKQSELPYDVVAVIKIGVDSKDISRKEFFEIAGKMLTSLFKSDKVLPIDWDKVLVIGTVKGVEYNQLRFIKFKENEQQILQAGNGNSGEQQ